MDNDRGEILHDNSDKKERRILDSVLDALNDDGIDPDLKRRMQSWFLSDFGDNAAKQDAFVRYAERIAPHMGELEPGDLKRFAELAARLGIPAPAGKGIATTERERAAVENGSMERRPASKMKRRITAWIWRCAAVVLPVAIAAAGFWLMSRDAEPDGLKMTVEASDGVRSLYLPDSSFVSVSPGSTLSYRESEDGSRAVDLSGEAMFMVRGDGGRSFSVSTENLTVNVRGTDFAVSEFSGSPYASVELFEGVVNVSAGGVDTTLRRGETLTRDNSANGVRIGVIPASRMIEKGYKPRLKFDRATVGEVIAALSAFHGIGIEAAPGIDVNTGSISGDIEDSTPEKALSTILRMWQPDLAQRREGDKIIIYRK